MAFPRGALWDESRVRLLHGQGQELPCQKTTVGRWSRHGSIKWLQLSFMSTPRTEESTYWVEWGTARAARRHTQTVVATDMGRHIVIDTGKLRVLIRKSRFNLIESARLDADGNGQYEESEEILSTSDRRGAFMVDQKGGRYTSGNDWQGDVIIEESGPLKVVVKAQGFQPR